MGVVFGLADRISVLVYGQIIASDTPERDPRERRGAGGLSRATASRTDARGPATSTPITARATSCRASTRRRRRRDRQPARPQRRRPLDHDQGDHGRRAAARLDPLQGRGHRRPASPTRSRSWASATCPRTATSFPTLTVRQNLLLGVKNRQEAGTLALRRHVRLFPRLEERADTPAGVLSGGEQQMLTICRTLMGDPDLIMIDEPTEGLAPHDRRAASADLLAEHRRARHLHPAGRAEADDRAADLAARLRHGPRPRSCSRARRPSLPPTPVRKDWLEV